MTRTDRPAILRMVARTALTATVVAGSVGAVRQLLEARGVARGDLERITAATSLPPPIRYGPLAARLATWVPTRPVTPTGRILASAWAGPLTAIGFALAGLAGARPSWDEELGCWVCRGARGPSRIALRAVGASANTVGQVVLAIRDDPSDALLAHEAVHVRQGERLGIALFPLYVWLGARYGYRDNPFERAARHGAALRLNERGGTGDGGALQRS